MELESNTSPALWPTSEMYYGTEAEGRWTGLYTLFVEGVPLRSMYDIQEAAKKKGVGHVYIGANQKPVQWTEGNTNLLMALVNNLLPECVFTFEHFVYAELRFHIPGFLLNNPRIRNIFTLHGFEDVVSYLDSRAEVKINAKNRASILVVSQTVDTTYLADKP